MKKFIDVTKDKKQPYLNFFIDRNITEDECLVLKVSLPKRANSKPSVKIEKFNLTKYNYLTPI